MKDQDSNKPAQRGGLSSLLQKKDLAKPILADWVRVMVYMTPEDHEIYKNFYWFMKNKSGNSHWGHKELQNHMMKLVTEQYGKLPERTDEQKTIEESKSKTKTKKQ